MHCTLFNHRAAQIQFFRATGNYIKDLGRQGRLAQKQRPLGRGEKNKKNAKKTQKNSRFFLIFQFFVFFRLARGGPVFFLIFFVLFFRIFSVVVFPFCVGVLFSSYFFRVHLPLLHWGPEDPKSNVSYSVFLQECFADMFSRNIEKPVRRKSQLMTHE